MNFTCPPDGLTQRTAELAARLADGPSVAYRHMKENLNRAVNGDVGECMDLEATHHVNCFATDDHKEAVAAFVAKRAPVFVGR